MANKQIDALAAFTTPAVGTDILHAKQGGVDKKITINQLRSEISSVGNFYTAGVSANAIELTAAGNTVGLTEYSGGLPVSFFATATNTAGVTWNVNGLGGRAAVINGSALTGDEITIGDLVVGVYDLANTRFEITSYPAHRLVVNKATETISGNKTFTGSGNIFNGITQANLVDKTATETVIGDWNFSSASAIFSGILGSNLVDRSASASINGPWSFNNAGNVYNGIAQTNLLDKSVTETVSGSWKFTSSIFHVGDTASQSSWSASFRAVTLGRTCAILYSDVAINSLTNSYHDGFNYKYVIDGYSTRHTQVNGEHSFDTAVSGSAGNTISYTNELVVGRSGVKVGIVIAQGAGTLNVRNGIYVDGNELKRTAVDEYTTIGTTSNLAAGAATSFSIAHGLGTDDVIVQVMCKGDTDNGSFEAVYITVDGFNDRILGGNIPTFTLTMATIPVSGSIGLRIVNRYPASQTISYKVRIIKRIP